MRAFVGGTTLREKESVRERDQQKDKERKRANVLFIGALRQIPSNASSMYNTCIYNICNIITNKNTYIKRNYARENERKIKKTEK